MKKERLLLCLFIGLLSFAFASAAEIRVTEEHPFLINDSWIPASQLEVGDILNTIDGKRVRIKNIRDVVSEKPFFVYNFEDSFGINNYVVDGDGYGGLQGIIVHNSGGSVIPPKGLPHYWPTRSNQVKVVGTEKVLDFDFGQSHSGRLSDPGFFEGHKTIHQGDMVRLLRRIEVPNAEVKSYLDMSNPELGYSSRLKVFKGNENMAINFEGEKRVPFIDTEKFIYKKLESVPAAIDDTLNSQGGYAISTSFNGEFIGGHPIVPGKTELVLVLDVPSNVFIPYMRSLPNSFNLQGTSISKYAFIAEDLYEAEVDFIGKIPKEYISKVVEVPNKAYFDESTRLDFITGLRGF